MVGADFQEIVFDRFMVYTMSVVILAREVDRFPPKKLRVSRGAGPLKPRRGLQPRRGLRLLRSTCPAPLVLACDRIFDGRRNGPSPVFIALALRRFLRIGGRGTLRPLRCHLGPAPGMHGS